MILHHVTKDYQIQNGSQHRCSDSLKAHLPKPQDFFVKQRSPTVVGIHMHSCVGILIREVFHFKNWSVGICSVVLTLANALVAAFSIVSSSAC
jgi:hypothetical protein